MPSFVRSRVDKLAGYAVTSGSRQPAPRDHPWRTMPFEGNDPHISGSSLSAQARYAAGVRRESLSVGSRASRSAMNT